MEDFLSCLLGPFAEEPSPPPLSLSHGGLSAEEEEEEELDLGRPRSTPAALEEEEEAPPAPCSSPLGSESVQSDHNYSLHPETPALPPESEVAIDLGEPWAWGRGGAGWTAIQAGNRAVSLVCGGGDFVLPGGWGWSQGCGGRRASSRQCTTWLTGSSRLFSAGLTLGFASCLWGGAHAQASCGPFCP